MSTSEDWIQFYPEIGLAGSLRNALTEAMQRMGSKNVVTGLPGVWPVAYARVASGDRFAQVHVAALKRLFLVEFWSRGVCMASGASDAIDQVACAINSWETSGNMPVLDLCTSFPWIRSKDAATAFEDGTAVDWAWTTLIHDESRSPELRSLVARASVEPRLRALFPYTSMGTLCFSRCTGFPYTRDTPCITPLGSGQYRVLLEAGREVARGSADFAVRLAVENLPVGCIAARSGPADDEKQDAASPGREGTSLRWDDQ